jgi:hypothetical protein
MSERIAAKKQVGGANGRGLWEIIAEARKRLTERRKADFEREKAGAIEVTAQVVPDAGANLDTMAIDTGGVAHEEPTHGIDSCRGKGGDVGNTVLLSALAVVILRGQPIAGDEKDPSEGAQTKHVRVLVEGDTSDIPKFIKVAEEKAPIWPSNLPNIQLSECL